jgi:excinuclease ABC subunit C
MVADRTTHSIDRALLSLDPQQPGVYLMLDKTDRIIYVGKAVDLRKRLASYRRVDDTEQNKTRLMLSKVSRIDTILTSTEKEALILEASLIKKHKPKYNIILRDDKNYPMIKVTVNEEWPRVMMTRRRARDGARYFGPYASSAAMWDTLRYLQTMFPLRRCKSKKFFSRTRPCLNFQMKRCPAPCVGKADGATYKENVNRILLALGGKSRELLNELERKMQAAAAVHAFEEAAWYRDQIQSLKNTLEKQIITSSHHLDQDVFGLVRQGDAVAIVVLFVRNGVVIGQRPFYFAEPLENDATILAEAVRQFYGLDNPVPDEVLLSSPIDGKQLLLEWLQDQKTGRIVLKIPKQGDRTKLVRMALANARQLHREKEKKAESWQELALEACDKLHLQLLPNRIECVDISNISGRQAVGSMVCFINGVRETAQYRKYMIRSVCGPDDYQMMEEVLVRRFTQEQKAGAADNAVLPDLLMLDGGKGHLNMAAKVLDRLGLTQAFDLLSIAKERADEGEKLYKPGRKNPLVLMKHSPVLLLLQRIRDEAHRFGITYHRQLRQKQVMRSGLDAIPGIGAERRKVLLKNMGSLDKIAGATKEELTRVPGIGLDLAKVIYSHFHPGEAGIREKHVK